MTVYLTMFLIEGHEKNKFSFIRSSHIPLTQINEYEQITFISRQTLFDHI